MTPGRFPARGGVLARPLAALAAGAGGFFRGSPPDYSEPHSRRGPLRRPEGKRLPDDFYERVADAYLEGGGRGTSTYAVHGRRSHPEKDRQRLNRSRTQTRIPPVRPSKGAWGFSPHERVEARCTLRDRRRGDSPGSVGAVDKIAVMPSRHHTAAPGTRRSAGTCALKLRTMEPPASGTPGIFSGIQWMGIAVESGARVTNAQPLRCRYCSDDVLVEAHWCSATTPATLFGDRDVPSAPRMSKVPTNGQGAPKSSMARPSVWCCTR